jgi:hypothetical protein
MTAMDRMRYVEPDRRDEIIADAARRSTPVVVTRRENQNWVSHKSHFRGATEDRSRLLIAAGDEVGLGRGEGLLRGERVGVAFRRGHRKCMFSAVVEEVSPAGDWLALQWPEQIQELQRRAYYRSAPPRGITLPIRFWAPEPGPRTGITAPPDGAHFGTMIDLSAGGIRISSSEGGDVEIGQTVLCHFGCKRGAPPMTLEATLRHRIPAERGAEALGFQFIGLETTPAGQKCLVRLAKIVSEFQQSTYRISRRPRVEKVPQSAYEI